MGEGRTRLLAFLGTVALHVLVVWWLASSPEATSRLLQAVEMEFVEVPPPAEPEPEPPPAPEPEPEVEPEPEPEPDPVRPRPQRRVEPPTRTEPDPRPATDQPPSDQPSDEPGEGEPDQEPGQRVIDFGEQNFALAGAGVGFAMAASSGGSRVGVYRPGARGGGGGGGPSAGGGAPAVEGNGFDPVPMSQLGRRAELIGRLERRYPDDARRRSIEGTVRLMVEIRSSGRIRGVRVLADPGGGLGEAAVAALRQARFRPALDRRGQPVDTRIVYRVRYILDV